MLGTYFDIYGAYADGWAKTKGPAAALRACDKNPKCLEQPLIDMTASAWRRPLTNDELGALLDRAEM